MKLTEMTERALGELNLIGLCEESWKEPALDGNQLYLVSKWDEYLITLEFCEKSEMTLCIWDDDTGEQLSQIDFPIITDYKQIVRGYVAILGPLLKQAFENDWDGFTIREQN
jgi:hypothetical protein